MPSTDYFAELYVAGRFADAGWNVYFPHRDQGFDFIASKEISPGEILIRPVQVKGKYPTEGKGNKATYGYIGALSILHPEMVLAIPFFSIQSPDLPTCVAYIPRTLIRTHSRGFRSEPASFKDGMPVPRRDYAKLFDAKGLSLMATTQWNSIKI